MRSKDSLIDSLVDGLLGSLLGPISMIQTVHILEFVMYIIPVKNQIEYQKVCVRKTN